MCNRGKQRNESKQNQECAKVLDELKICVCASFFFIFDKLNEQQYIFICKIYSRKNFNTWLDDDMVMCWGDVANVIYNVICLLFNLLFIWERCWRWRAMVACMCMFSNPALFYMYSHPSVCFINLFGRDQWNRFVWKNLIIACCISTWFLFTLLLNLKLCSVNFNRQPSRYMVWSPINWFSLYTLKHSCKHFCILFQN